MSTANDRQVGGDHYRGAELQHWDLVVMFEWCYFQAQIIKYVMRFRKKNGKQDLEKAQHFLQKLIEVEYPDVVAPSSCDHSRLGWHEGEPGAAYANQD